MACLAFLGGFWIWPWGERCGTMPGGCQRCAQLLFAVMSDNDMCWGYVCRSISLVMCVVAVYGDRGWEPGIKSGLVGVFVAEGLVVGLRHSGC